MAMSAPVLRLPPRFALSFSLSSRRPLRQLSSDFSGQKLRLSKSRVESNIHAPCVLIIMQLKKNSHLAHEVIEDNESFLDDVCDWISKQVGQKARPLLPENFDLLDWIPSGLHSRIHSAERAATVFVRECLMWALFAFIFARIGGICRWLSRTYYSRAHEGKKAPEFHYEGSVFRAMEDPLRAGVLLWQLTHSLQVVGPLFKLKLSLLMIEKVRSIGLIVAVTWFLFKWKDLVLQRLIAGNKAEAPRYIALDKVLSLLMYYIAGTCIGEVSGFALRSVLAVGGVSGIAIGLAAKEIVGNFLGGALLFVTRPFVIGDRVKANLFEGRVQDIDFLHTKLIGYDQSPVLVPNSAIMNEIIVNHSRAKCRQLNAVFLLRNEDVFLIDKITDEITEFLANHERVDLKHGTKPLCYLKNMGPEGLELELLCSIKEEGAYGFFKAKQEILVKAAKIVTSAGACFETNASVVLMSRDGPIPTAEVIS